MTDDWKPYEHFVPPEKHTQSKAETFTVEGYNSLFRHVLARVSAILCKREIVYCCGIRPSNKMVNRFNAAFQSWIGIVHFLLMLRSAR